MTGTNPGQGVEFLGAGLIEVDLSVTDGDIAC